ncbi:MAG TPA: TlpA disulfide reductase family protein [Solirubrobacterales bacterium]|nr:TlpA disulfide reductase family protein [Solirubrobacterales bacterium]
MTDNAKTQQTRSRRFLLITLIAFVVLMVILIATRDGDKSNGEGGAPPDYAKLLSGSPAPLAAIHKQSNELLDGGKDAFEARMGELKGYPAVVNVWASWCGPCRAEFPHLQEAGANLGKKVAFLGVDSDDDADAAKTFLEDNPLPYPSYSDPDKAISNSLGATHGFPATAFFDAEGEQTFIKHGPYTSQRELEDDIRAYAIEGGG